MKQYKHEPLDNKIKYFFRNVWLLISAHRNTVGQYQLVLYISIGNRLKTRFMACLVCVYYKVNIAVIIFMFIPCTFIN